MVRVDSIRQTIEEVTNSLVSEFFDVPKSGMSLAEMVGLWPDDVIREFYGGLSAEDAMATQYLWPFWARPKQLWPSTDWQYWLVLAGRGFGKTRTICEWVIHKAREMPGSRGFIAGATAGDVRDILIEGESGIVTISPPDFRPHYEPSKRRLTWPNGAVATLFSAEEPDRARGPQYHWGIADELASWKYLDGTWDNLMMGLRLGDNPQVAIATTPRPLTILKELIEDEGCVVTRGSTYENTSNLAATFFKKIIKKYEGTRLGKQELHAELLWDVPGSLWKMGERGQSGTIEGSRVSDTPQLLRIVVGVDPPGSTAECGIVVAGIGADGYLYILDDCSIAGSPAEWGAAVVAAYHKWRADAIIAEANQGGNMVTNTITTIVCTKEGRPVSPVSVATGVVSSEGLLLGANLPVKLVWASRGKYTRAEPVSAVYEQGRARHVGAFPDLESQMTTWVPGKTSPDRMDAMVWASTDLLFTAEDQYDDMSELAEVSASRW